MLIHMDYPIIPTLINDDYAMEALIFSSYTVVPSKFFTVNSTFCALLDLKLMLVSALNGFGYAETDKSVAGGILLVVYPLFFSDCCAKE